MHSGTSFKFDYLPDASTWAGVAQTSVDSDAVLTVDRWEMASTTVYSGNAVKMRFAKGSLLGSIYYWEILNANLGRVLRINDGTNVASSSCRRRPRARSTTVAAWAATRSRAMDATW
ncbi:hypothetical protein [Haliangium sp. UPWRP_2]|uniref:hypothetical protein n=1 Tax=Haliangium sp. UPWRP_2 TaxID=1931276 RepID=UPI000B53B5F0|nr:hypothetical protein [Haliangium sp. UPWRP_2]PSM31570.1 hypothetical protein BVG81_004730 [Haliangium sp. UPWRP_2]